MKKIVTVSYNDITYDPKGAGELVLEACSRKHPMKIAGSYVLDDKLLLFLEEGTNNVSEFVFSKTKAVSEEDAIAVVEHRYIAGYSTLTLFHIDDAIWGLFAKS